jgi:hypothetical protein
VGSPSTRVVELIREIASSIELDPRGDDLVANAAVAVEELVVADEERRAQADSPRSDLTLCEVATSPRVVVRSQGRTSPDRRS